MVVKYKKEVFFFSIVGLVIFLDQLSKYLFLKFNLFFNLKLFTLHLVENTGAAFGLFKHHTWILTLISILVVVVIIYLYPKIPSERKIQLSAALFLGGTIGNLIDRLFRSFVVDFIDFGFWPAFNLADSCITIGVIGLIIYLLRTNQI